MTATQIGELIGAVVTVLIALAGYLNSRTAKKTAANASQAVHFHEISPQHQPPATPADKQP